MKAAGRQRQRDAAEKAAPAVSHGDIFKLDHACSPSVAMLLPQSFAGINARDFPVRIQSDKSNAGRCAPKAVKVRWFIWGKDIRHEADLSELQRAV